MVEIINIANKIKEDTEEEKKAQDE